MVALLACVAVWPFAHRVLVATYDTGPWQLGGFAMYATWRGIGVSVHLPEDGKLVPLPFDDATPAVRAAWQRYQRQRRSLGRWASPKPLAREVLRADPTLGSVVVVEHRRFIDRGDGRIGGDSELHPFVRAELFEDED